MTDFSSREARLRPEFAHLYPALTAGQWESAAILADRVVSLLLRNSLSRFVTTDRILPPEHFDFRGDARRPESLPEGHSRRGDHA
jgi:hypothetical protein